MVVVAMIDVAVPVVEVNVSTVYNGDCHFGRKRLLTYFVSPSVVVCAT